ncbi:MAG: VOC family protein [Candidatus Abawacabacteria bacterium]|nr:VOC family protein [Candidatus Abawacabacteria bacterium]
MKSLPLPPNYHSIMPYLRMRNAKDAITFYEQVFAAKVVERVDQPDGRIGHVEMNIGDSIIMFSDEFPEINILGPQSIGGASVGILLYIDDVDDCVAKALANGAKLITPVTDQFYGDRSGKVIDPFGHEWVIATHIEHISHEEMQKRIAAMPKNDAQ